jgi:hypothetical protein
MASQMTSAVDGRVEHPLQHAIVLLQQVMSALDVESAAEVEAKGEEEGEHEGAADRWSRRMETQLHDFVEGEEGSKGCGNCG